MRRRMGGEESDKGYKEEGEKRKSQIYVRTERCRYMHPCLLGAATHLVL